MGTSERDILRTAKDKELWKSVATNILIEHCTQREREGFKLFIEIMMSYVCCRKAFK